MHGTFRGDSTGDIYAELLNGKVDGLVLHVPSDDPLVPRLAASHLPVVAVANPVPNLASVTVDDAGGSRLLARHLAEKGHRRVAYGVSPFKLSSAIRRYEAFCAEAGECGLSVLAERAREADDLVSDFERWYLSLPAAQRPTAVVCWNDHSAYLLIEHLRTLGMRVPDDVAVAGFDGAASVIPPAYRLTSVRAPWRQVAQTAVTLLIENQGKPAPDETMLPVELIVGDTA
jgi:DNA-binding LacI/PurR family transcriptional regulator